MLKRFIDILFSFTGLLFSLPVFLLISVAIKLDSRGKIFFLQKRVGMGGKEFNLIKFRTMVVDADKSHLITVGVRDPRITRIGYFLRKIKMDELPQLINVLKGEMSIVGPRPEVKKYVDMYTEEQKRILSVKPGITSPASIEYINENEILGKSVDPEYTYIHEIMPKKLLRDLDYVNTRTFGRDIVIIFRTFSTITRKK